MALQLPTRSCVVVIGLSRGMHGRMIQAVRPQLDIRECATVQAVIKRARVADTAAVVLGARDRDGVPTDSTIASLHRICPTLPLLVCLAPGSHTSEELTQAVTAGATGILFEDASDMGVVIRAAIDSATAQSTARVVLRDIAGQLPADVQLIVAHCLHHAREALSVDALSRALCLDRRTLVRRLSRARMPSPRTLIAWCRLLHVARALEDERTIFDRLARDHDFASPSALRNMLQRYTAMRPLELRAAGGLKHMMVLFRAALRCLAPTGTANLLSLSDASVN